MTERYLPPSPGNPSTPPYRCRETPWESYRASGDRGGGALPSLIKTPREPRFPEDSLREAAFTPPQQFVHAPPFRGGSEHRDLKKTRESEVPKI